MQLQHARLINKRALSRRAALVGIIVIADIMQ